MFPNLREIGELVVLNLRGMGIYNYSLEKM